MITGTMTSNDNGFDLAIAKATFDMTFSVVQAPTKPLTTIQTITSKCGHHAAR